MNSIPLRQQSGQDENYMAGWLTTRRHYGGLQRTMSRLDARLSEFRFTSVSEWLSEHPL